MKHTKLMALGTLLLLAVGGAAAQSLGDYARAARKNKPESNAASRHYDNDNLPSDQAVSVVGPAPAADANAAQAANAPGADPAAAAAERQKAADEWKEKFDKQKAKIDALNHELDVDQRELRLRAILAASDSSPRVSNPAKWDKDEEKCKSEVEAKQKDLDAARQELDEMQDQARKAGIAEKDNDNGKDKDNDKDKK